MNVRNTILLNRVVHQLSASDIVTNSLLKSVRLLLLLRKVYGRHQTKYLYRYSGTTSQVTIAGQRFSAKRTGQRTLGTKHAPTTLISALPRSFQYSTIRTQHKYLPKRPVWRVVLTSTKVTFPPLWLATQTESAVSTYKSTVGNWMSSAGIVLLVLRTLKLLCTSHAIYTEGTVPPKRQQER